MKDNRNRTYYENPEDDSLRWEAVKCEHLVEDEWIDFRKVAYRFPDGTVAEPFYTYSRRDYVVVVATDENGKYLCVRQYRHGIDRVTTEFPAGGIERFGGRDYRTGDEKEASVEDSLESAKRELMEETGYEAEEWEHLLTIPSNATIADNYVYIYRARGCRKVAGQHLDEYEFINVKLYDAEEIERRIHGGDFLQAVHVMAWLLAKERDAR